MSSVSNGQPEEKVAYHGPGQLVVCTCGSIDHMLFFADVPDPDFDDVLYVYGQLHPLNGFWKRLWLALQYVLGFPTCGSHWTELAISLDEGRRLRDFLDAAVNDRDAKFNEAGIVTVADEDADRV